MSLSHIVQELNLVNFSLAMLTTELAPKHCHIYQIKSGGCRSYISNADDLSVLPQ